jgi:RNA polymerase sigma factor (sigma-70 family)
MQFTQQTDTELVRKYQSGSEHALEEIIGRHKDRLFGYIRMMVKDSALAEDIFQDTFIKVIKTLKAGNYNEEGKFLPWVLRISHNLIIDHFRKEKRMPTYSGTETFDIFDVIKSEDKNVDQEMFWGQVYEDVKKLVDFLPEEQKQVLKMRLYNEMSFKDIAEETNVSINTALGRMRYALINMRKMIAENNMVMTDE